MLENLRQAQKQFETEHKLQIICFGSYVDKSSKTSILSATSRLNCIRNQLRSKASSGEFDKFRTQIDPTNLQRSLDNIFHECAMQTDAGQKNVKYLSFLAFIEKTMLGLKKRLQSQHVYVDAQRKTDKDLKQLFEQALQKQMQNPEIRKHLDIKNKIRSIIDKCNKGMGQQNEGSLGAGGGAAHQNNFNNRSSVPQLDKKQLVQRSLNSSESTTHG